MKMLNSRWFCRGAAVLAVALVSLLPTISAAQTVSGEAINQSRWADTNALMTIPGDGDGQANLIVGLWGPTAIRGTPAFFTNVATTASMPFGFNAGFAFSITTVGLTGAYQVVAWVDANEDGRYDIGEPRSAAASVQMGSADTPGISVVVVDDLDNDTLLDWWEAHWFRNCTDPLSYNAADDPDNDSLTNIREYAQDTNPAGWDSDGDGMDDAFEVKYRGDLTVSGLNPRISDSLVDSDGDGLSNWQEYLGVDGIAPKSLDFNNDCIIAAKDNNTTDTLNPLDIDTDFDLLIDSFEAAWFDPAGGIDPAQGATIPTNGAYSLSIAMADPDQDGLGNYREQCLLTSFRQGGSNGDKWVWLGEPNSVPFPFYTYLAHDGTTVRMCNLGGFSGGTALTFAGMNNSLSVRATVNRTALRTPATGWTDPTDGTGYNLVDENIPSGHDTDNDGLPDGWEIEFGLDPRSNAGINGPFGDPDGDTLLNYEEFVGADGNRSATKPYANGTGDETNPNIHNWRPDSTYQWRWLLTNALVTPITDPRNGTGVNRAETLGAALPTLSVGFDIGTDSDDDGISDALEINPATAMAPSSPVDSTDPFIMRSALITSPSGIVIPDPEPAVATNSIPAGVREDMQRRDWTIECLVKLLDTGLSGDLIAFNTSLGGNSRAVYRLQLSNNIPVLSADINSSRQVVSANPLPTNQWVHLAAVWDHKNNSLSLRIQGVLFVAKQVFGESVSSLMYPSTNSLAFGVSAGSFVNKLMIDEIRVWGLARPEKLISEYAFKLLPQNNGDDAWISATPGGYFYDTNDVLLVNGGSLFEGETGVALTNVLVNGGNYWIDDGNGIYQSMADILVARGSGPLVEGVAGTAVANVLYNDKDGSGGYTRDSLLAYYRFDDGGATAEDFARKAKTGLKDATLENYRFGDFGYALPTNGISISTNSAAPVYGVHRTASDDTDNDGLPDAWEVIHGLNPLDNGTGGESSPGLHDGPNGALGDSDGDGLNNLNEFWSGTNPGDSDTDNNSTPDGQEDFDGDTLSNITEQQLGSRPDIIDTDDDGVPDNTEVGNVTSPVDSLDLPVSRGVSLGGTAADYLEVPNNLKQRLTSWTIEAFVNPAALSGGKATLLRRSVENIGSSNVLNYVLGLETNGAGGFMLYGGYTGPAGQPFILKGGNVPTGTYTHVAASYDNATASLVLYVAGLPVTNINTFSLAPPANGKGGEAFVRIGENFAGQLDEVRVWNSARSAGQILSNSTQTVSSSDPSLVHYFRLDDGGLTAEDFTYSQDWNTQWRHAANFHGSVAFTVPGSIVPPPTLRINLLPAEAILLGAQWSVDGGAFNDSGASLDLTAGPHSIIYKSIPGWSSPTNEVIVLTNGIVTTLTRSYIQHGAILVNIEPAAIATAGAFRVDGGTFLPTGTLVTNVAPGSHTIDFASVPGWIEPTSSVVTVLAANTTIVTRAYTPASGWLTIVLSPTNVIPLGAQWRINGGSWNNSGDTLLLQTGSYSTDYRAVIGYITPSNETITINYNTTSIVARTYLLNTNLVDTDSDGLPDTWEVTYFGNLTQTPTNDPDADLLNNLQEYQHGTNPTLWDTDGDGFSDGYEVTRGSDPLNPLSVPPKHLVNDFDGDGASDLTVYWPGGGNWYIRQSSNNTPRVQNWGYSATITVPGDYDGDRITDIAVFEPGSSKWYIMLSATKTQRILTWLTSTDTLIPVPADYDGDLVDDVAVYKPSAGGWYIAPSMTNSAGIAINWGWSDAKPAPGDYDGDGKSDLAVYWPAGGLWYILQSSTDTMLGGTPKQWGWSQAQAVPGDYDGDGRTDIAVYSAANGNWYILKSSNGQMLGGAPINWGFSQAIPIPGDYDNDGKTDIAVYWPAGGLWYIRKSSDGTIMGGAPINWGWSAALPPHSP